VRTTTRDNRDNGVENGGSNQSDGLPYALTLLLSSFLPSFLHLACWLGSMVFFEPLLPSFTGYE
jgi:hypothetical protein